MSLLFMDGFAGNDIATKWDAGSVNYTYGNTSPRATGGYWTSLGFGNNTIYKSFPAQNKIFTGYGLFNGSGYLTIYGDTGATAHVTVIRNTSTGVIEIRRGGNAGTLLASSTATTTGAWYYLEVSATISDTIGEVHVRLNGGTTDIVSYTGDTKNAGTNTTIDRISLTTLVNGMQIADFYLVSDAGATNNTFLGDVTVRTLSPNGNGNTSQLVGSDADSVNNYLLVDELPFNGTDYTGSAVTNNKDTYLMQDLPALVSTVYGVQVSGSMVKSDPGAAQSRLLLRSGGTNYPGTTRTLAVSSATYTELYEQNPATSAAWTTTNVNAVEAGMEVM